MVIAALVSFAILLIAWILAPSEAAPRGIDPIAIQPEPETETVPIAA